MSIENEIAHAWQLVWNNGIAAGSLGPSYGYPSVNVPNMDGLVPGGLHTDEVTQGRAVPTDPNRPTPYAILTIKAGQKPKFRMGGWLDYRQVTVEVYGPEQSKQTMGVVANAMHRLYDYLPLPQLLQINIDNPNAWHAWNEYDEEDEKPDQSRKKHGRHPRLLRMLWTCVTNRTKNYTIP